jgi:hypothetical protein
MIRANSSLGSSVAMINGMSLEAMGFWDSSTAASQPGDPLLAPSGTPGYPKPVEKVVVFVAITTLQQAYAYAYSGWAASVSKMGSATGDAKGLWETAGRKYRAAALMTAQIGSNVDLVKRAISDANRTADAARLTGGKIVRPPFIKPPLPPVPEAKSRWPLYAGLGLVAAFGLWRWAK